MKDRQGLREGEECESAPVTEVAAYDYKCVLSCEIRSKQLTVFALLVLADSSHQNRDNFDVCIWIYHIDAYY